MSKPSITLIMPVYNGVTTLTQAFDGLDQQTNKALIDHIVILNDNSSDGSREIIEAYAAKSKYNVRVINHRKSRGLAAGYNEGIAMARTPYVLLMHQDMVLPSKESFALIVAPFEKPDVVASYPVLLHPYKVWKGYSFWQKCLFSRFVGKKLPMLTGKFDCFDREFLATVGNFDSRTYRTAGEDSDVKIKIKRCGKQAVNSGVEAIHLQYAEKDFGLKKFIKKEAQLAEAQGVLLRKYGIHDVRQFPIIFFRQALLIGGFIPFVWPFLWLLIFLYSFFYTRLVYEKEYKNPLIALLPLVNIALLVVALAASARGFITGRQRI